MTAGESRLPVLAASLLTLLVLPACHRVTSAQLAEASRLAGEADAVLRERNRAFASAIKTLDRLRPSDAPCEVPPVRGSLPIFSRDFARWVVLTKSSLRTTKSPFQSEGVTIVDDAAQLTSLGSSAAEALRDQLASVKRREGQYEKLNGDELVTKARTLASTLPTAELVVVVQAATAAKPQSEKTFIGGAVMGRAYVFDAKTGGIPCMGEVAAQSSETVSMVRLKSLPRDASGDVNLDLYRNLLERAVESLRKTQ